ncbi:MAG: hypothetical protein IIA82_00975 [Thaumarchaeota archaeon]|nr:hypothetical protein [Nitrososphaerota archaeon]
MNKEYYKKIALKWAPIHYQYIKLDYDKNMKDVSFETKTDLLVPVNLDGYTNVCECGCRFDEHNTNNLQSNDVTKNCCNEFIRKYKNKEEEWDTRDIRNRLKKAKIKNLVPVVYYSIATTSNHFFILYSFYHANDEKHPNDMEGCLVIIERDKENDENNRLVGMMTVAHLYFPRYVYKNRLKFDKESFLDIITSDKNADKKRIKQIKKRLNILGTQGNMEADDENDTTRALTQQETQGHGLYALGENLVFPFNIIRKIKTLFGKLDFVVYYPGTYAKPYDVYDLIRYKGMPHYSSLYYELVDIHDEQGLCHRISNNVNGNSTFNENGKFHGNSASPPWLWVEKKDGKELTFWNEPAELADLYFEPSDSTKPFIDNDGYKKTMSQNEDGHEHVCDFQKY